MIGTTTVLSPLCVFSTVLCTVGVKARRYFSCFENRATYRRTIPKMKTENVWHIMLHLPFIDRTHKLLSSWESRGAMTTSRRGRW